MNAVEKAMVSSGSICGHEYTIHSDIPVLHYSETEGTRITREQMISVDGLPFHIVWWTDFNSGRVVFIDSRPMNAAAAAFLWRSNMNALKEVV